MSNPYSGLQDYQFWRRSVSRVEPHRLDPVVAPKFSIEKSDLVATAGSCFAQHISRKLSQIGFSYYVPEDGEGIAATERSARNFGVFSARYGNIYTTHQLLQLFSEAVVGRKPHDLAWQRSDGRYVDPFRPQVEPEGFSTQDEVVAARQEHLAKVRDVFLKSNVLIFTLGLTESWRSKVDHSVFPLAPGVAGGSFDETVHEYVNFGVDEVFESLNNFLTLLKGVNPEVKVLLTVSPVPLIATYEDRHVIVSTVYSKSVLRVAAEMATKGRDWVDYFPSYEIITSSASGGAYYAEDYREVTPVGVAHAMRCFVNHYAGEGQQQPAPIDPDLQRLRDEATGVVCDEEALDAIG